MLATGRYLGEGFDDASLDTLFLTMPISWKGTLAQYVGRLHREHHAKREVIVYDYVDSWRGHAGPHGTEAAGQGTEASGMRSRQPTQEIRRPQSAGTT